jgi:hypothetical protein
LDNQFDLEGCFPERYIRRLENTLAKKIKLVQTNNKSDIQHTQHHKSFNMKFTSTILASLALVGTVLATPQGPPGPPQGCPPGQKAKIDSGA